MSLNNTKKIFIDISEEVTNVTSQIIHSQEERVILVAPESSLIFSNLISLSLIHRMASKYNKQAILVTEDEFGISSAQRIGFVTVQKVSQINEELWDIAKDKLLKFKSDLERKLKQDDEIEELRKDIIEPIDAKIDPVEESDISENSEEPENEINNNSEEVESTESTNNEANQKDISFNNFQKKVSKPTFKFITKGNIAILPGQDVSKVRKEESVSERVQPRDNQNTFAGRDFKGEEEKKESLISKLFHLGKENTSNISSRTERLLKGREKPKSNKKLNTKLNTKGIFIVFILIPISTSKASSSPPALAIACFKKRSR
ncbi:MAG: hypothetical protein Q9M76_06730 [Candidatus Dojkabacteria bacterium]|nr:hypothetical protein [Candidatus Dojkabacteria bacterium]